MTTNRQTVIIEAAKYLRAERQVISERLRNPRWVSKKTLRYYLNETHDSLGKLADVLDRVPRT